MKKIFVHKDEYVAEIIDTIISDADREFVLVIPKGAAIKESASNFQLIRREAEAAGKQVLVESVDEEILALAHQGGLESAHPLFHKASGSFSDIVPLHSREEKKKVSAKAPSLRARLGRKSKEEKVALVPQSEENFFSQDEEERDETGTEGSEEGVALTRRQRRKRRLFIGAGALVVLIGLGIFITNHFLGRATITIRLKKAPWSYEGQFVVDKALAHFDADRHAIPGELFSQDKNVVQTYPASSNQDVQQKAKGKITIFNAYSSQAQAVVATTRFVTPDGKVFRLVNGVTIPGAQIKDGKIIPTSIDADIVADQAGPTYNIGPVAKLTIPGFQGTPKYDGFYGTIKDSTTGGFIGKKNTPTDADLKAADKKVTEVLNAALANALAGNVPPEFKVIEGGSVVTITKKNVNKDTDAQGNFSIFGEATAQALGFRESDLTSFLNSTAERDNANLVLGDLKIDYRNVGVDLAHGQMTFGIAAQGALRPKFNTDEFREKLLGQSVGTLKSLVESVPELADARVSLWPFWLTRLPQSSQKVTVTVE